MFLEQIKKYAQIMPDRTAVSDLNRTMTYRELWQEVIKKRTVLMSRRKNQDIKILLMMDNSCDWVTNVLAFMTIGAKTITISPDTAEAQVEYLCTKLGVDEIVTKNNCRKFFESEQLQSNDVDISEADNQKELIYHVSSGSTGDIKVCIRTLEEFEKEGEMYKDCLKMCERDVIVCPLPLYHSYAFGAVFISGLMTGATLVLMNKFTPRSYMEVLDREKATLSFIVPAMAKLLISCRLRQAAALSDMRYLVVGAGQITNEVFLGFKDRFGIALSSNYGSTETGGIITRTDGDCYPSVGKPMKGVFVQIRDNNGNLSETGTEGFMWVKADSIMNRYFHKDDILDQKGYFFTGDLASMDKDGNIFITGRAKNIVNIGGKKVNPVYVENVFRNYPTISDVVVVGKKRSNGGECLAAVIALKSELDRNDLNRYLHKKLEQYMIPTTIKVVDALPENGMGKISRKEIMAILS